MDSTAKETYDSETSWTIQVSKSVVLITMLALVGLFLGLNAFIIPYHADIFKSLRVDQPLPTRLTLQLSKNSSALALVLTGIAFILYAIRNRTLIVIFLLFLSAMLVLEPLSIYLFLFKIQDALRKR